MLSTVLVNDDSLRAFFDTLSLGVQLYRLEQDGRLVLTAGNAAADRILGMVHGSQVGRTLEEIFPALVGTEVAAYYRRLCSQGGDWRRDQVDLGGTCATATFDVHAFSIAPGAMAVVFASATESPWAKTELESRLNVERLMATVSSVFLKADHVDEAISEAIAIVGRLRKADRVYLIQYDESSPLMSNTHEWCADGIEPQCQNLQHVDVDTFPWWMEQLRRGATIVIPDVSAMPPEAARERAALAAMDIQSLVVLPVYMGGRLLGFLGFDYVRSPCLPADEDVVLLRRFAEIIGSALWRQRSEDALRTSEEKYANLFQQSKDGVLIHDLDGNIIDANRRALEMLGYERNMILGKKIADLHPPEAIEISRRAFEWIREAGVITFEVMFQRGDGRVFPAEVFASLFEVSGRRLVQGIIHDISGRLQDKEDRRRLEERLRQSEKMEAIGELAGGIAHDFNNMLAVIQGNAELLLMSLPKGSEQAELVDQIFMAGKRVANRTRQLLEFARKTEFQRIHVDLNAVIHEVIGLLEHGVDRRIEIVSDLAAPQATVLGDPAWLQTALLNLGLNARDAMPEGGRLTFGTRNVTFTTLDIGDMTPDLVPGLYVEISVTDTGVGMDKNVQSRIFDPFFTTKETGKGTGLGLALVYSCVKSHQGTIRVYSEPGHGSTFRFYLPVMPSMEPPAPPPDDDELVMGHGHVLLVDDEQLVRRFAEVAIRNLGYTVSVCSDGEEAIAFFRRHHHEIALVILDLIMPKMTGVDVFRELQRIDPNVKVLIASGFSHADIAEEIMKAGAVGFIKKPFQIDRLSQEIGRHIGIDIR